MDKTMTPFFDFYVKRGTEAARSDPGWADRQLLALLRDGPFRIARPGADAPARGRFLVIGVATWCGYDMRLLDVVTNALKRRPTPDLRIDVFNIADCPDKRAFAQYVPQLRHVFHSPMAGYWVDGRLEWSKEGYDAREAIAVMFGSTSAEIVEFVRGWVRARATATES